MSSPMPTTPSAEEVEKQVLSVIANVLERDAAEVRLDTSLEGDLGAESLDYLDIAFSLERIFHIQFPRTDFLQRAVDHFGQDKLWKDEAITDFGVELLRRSLPEIDQSVFKKDMNINELRKLFTPATLVRVTQRLLQAKSETPRACAKCGASMKDAEVAPELVCTACGDTVPFKTGDEIMIADLIALGEQIAAEQAST